MKNNTQALVQQALLEPSNLNESKLEALLGNMSKTHQIDYADVYLQAAYGESWHLEDRIVKDADFYISSGAGVRAIEGEKIGFAYANDINEASILRAADAAKTIARVGQSANVSIPRAKYVEKTPLYLPLNPLTTLTEQEKVDLLLEVDQVAHAQDPRVVEASITLGGGYSTILVLATDGTLSTDIRPIVRLNVSVIVEENGKREQGFFGGGARSGYEFFFDEKALAKHYAKEAVREALVNLAAIPAPAGNMPVVLGPGWPGVLLHEAVGHGLEGDFIRKKTSAFANKLGERVASNVCTVVDDATLAGRRGSLSVDDEGVPAQNTVLIENGILKGFMLDKFNAKLLNMASTGNGRRESFSALPLPRMTNTYMLPGQYTPEEIIASVDNGLYAVNFGGGQVDITSGKFVFSMSEAYLIENGKVTRPVKGATLIGNGPDVLTKVSMVGNDLKLDSGVGSCGKDGQSVPVGVGQPTLKVDELTVGGTG